MSETTQNRFRQLLDAGEFSLLIEAPAPSLNLDPIAAGERLGMLEKAVLEIPDINASLAITDRYLSLDSWRAIEYANALSEDNRDRHVVYVSGRNAEPDDIMQLAVSAAKAGLRNLVPVSGNCVPGDTPRETRCRPFAESIDITRKFAAASTEFHLGGTVNPYAYTPYTLMGQYFKVVKKLRSGASFVVAQAGWDMLKLQSLRWYFTGRSLHYPMIARLILLTPNLVEKILEGGYPGVNISPDFRKILENELRYSLNQFEAAQLRRLELQAAGCRLLGFSGIQLAGAETPARARIAADRIVNALREFTTFKGWLEEYNSYLARAEMSPSSRSFYLYDHTLRRPYPEEGIPAAREIGVPQISGPEKIGDSIRRFLFVNEEKNESQRFFKLFFGCRICSNFRLAKSAHVCTEKCPKGLRNAPCGGVRPDGDCELMPYECVFSKVARVAYWNDRLQTLEDDILE